MSEPLVSIIMPVFNAEDYLHESMMSILNQTYQNIELIIVDDGCTDNSMKVVDSFNDKRVRIIRNTENIGLAASLNKAIGVSRGAFLARMDADDIAYPQRIQKQVSYLESNPGTDILGSAMRYIVHSRFVSLFPETHEECRTQLLFNVCFGHPTVMFRNSVFERKENYYNEDLRQYSEDYDLWCRLVNRCRFSNIPDTLLSYRALGPEIKGEAERLRRQNSVVIQKSYLTSTLGQITLQEMGMHIRVSLLDPVETVAELNECGKWLSKIAALNDERGSFDRVILRDALAKRFFELCYHNADLGFSSFFLFYRSAWFRMYNPPLKLMVKYFVKTMIGKFRPMRLLDLHL